MANSIALNLYAMTFQGVADFGDKLHGGFQRLAADYPGPTPSLAVAQSNIIKLNKGIVKWGTKGNRGAHTDYSGILSQVEVVRNDIRSWANYAMITKPNDIKSWTDLGFAIRQAKSKSQQLQMVQDFRHFISRNVPAPGIKLRWRKPLDTKSNLVKSYIVQWNNTPDYPMLRERKMLMNVVAVVTETTFTDMRPLPGVNWYWVTPHNSAGPGVTSQGLMVLSAQLPGEEEQ